MRHNFLQFELWHDCPNNCAFCHNKGSDDIDKINSMNFVFEKLNDKSLFLDFDELGFIGGEFFDISILNDRVITKFYDLMDIVVNLIQTDVIHKFYITSGLMFSDKQELTRFCNYVTDNDIVDNVLICTSYDTIGRFIGGNSELNWHNNMLYLKNNFPDIKRHIEIILTGDFIQRCNDKRFNIIDFSNQYAATIDYISPHIIDRNTFLDKTKNSKTDYNKFIPNFFPKRNDFINFVKYECIETKSIPIYKFLSNDIRADRVYMIYDGKHVVIDNRRETDGIFAGMDKVLGITYIDGYIDSDVRMESDIENLRELYL